MSVCNMITMAEDLCGRLPAQTPVDPDQIKLFCSILNYMMHLEKQKKKKKEDKFPCRKQFTKGVRFLGAIRNPWGKADTWVLKHGTDEDWKPQSNGTFGSKAAATEDTSCFLRLLWAGQWWAWACAVEKGQGCLSASLLCIHSTRHCALLLAPLRSVRSESSASREISFFPKVFITFHPINQFSFQCRTTDMN